MVDVVRYTAFDTHKLSYSKPVNKQNVYYGDILYQGNACYIQSAKLQVESIHKDKQTLTCSVDPSDFGFYDFLVALDDYNLDTTYQSSNCWFQKELPTDVLESMYTRITKPFKKNEVPRIDLKLSAGKATCSLYDQNNNEITIDDISKGDTVIAIIHMKGLKFLKKKYTCDVYISQIKVSTPYPIAGCLIEDDELDLYEILDEEVITQNEEKLLLSKQIKALETRISTHNSELIKLKELFREYN